MTNPILKYELIGQLGAGATSIVYKAFNPDDPDKFVALKVMKIGPHVTPQNIEREIGILENLSKYPNCNPYIICYISHYYDHQDKIIDIVTEFIDGMDFRTLLDQSLISDFGMWVQLYSDVVDGLAFIHSKKVVHRDIKLENLMFDGTTQRAKLIDFGFACAYKESEKSIKAGTLCKDIPGTPLYAAPELFKRGGIRTLKDWKAADIYSLGTAMFISFNGGKNPFPIKEGNLRHLITMKSAFSAAKSSSGIPIIDELVDRMLNTNPDERPNIKVIKQAMDTLME